MGAYNRWMGFGLGARRVDLTVFCCGVIASGRVLVFGGFCSVLFLLPLFSEVIPLLDRASLRTRHL